MFFRYFLTLCVIALFSVAIHASAEEDVVDSSQVEDRAANPAVKAVAKFIGSLFVNAAKSCVTLAAFECKSHWKNPGEAISCAKNFLKVNQGRCAVGK